MQSYFLRANIQHHRLILLIIYHFFILKLFNNLFSTVVGGLVQISLFIRLFQLFNFWSWSFIGNRCGNMNQFFIWNNMLHSHVIYFLGWATFNTQCFLLQNFNFKFILFVWRFCCAIKLKTLGFLFWIWFIATSLNFIIYYFKRLITFRRKINSFFTFLLLQFLYFLMGNFKQWRFIQYFVICFKPYVLMNRI